MLGHLYFDDVWITNKLGAGPIFLHFSNMTSRFDKELYFLISYTSSQLPIYQIVKHFLILVRDIASQGIFFLFFFIHVLRGKQILLRCYVIMLMVEFLRLGFGLLLQKGIC